MESRPSQVPLANPKDFPALPSQQFIPAPLPRVNAWAKRSSTQPAMSRPSVTMGATGTDDLAELAKEIAELNSVINIRGLIQAVRNFKASVLQARSPFDKVEAAQRFSEEINHI